MKQALICCAIAFVITAAIGPSVIRYLRKMKFGQKILEIGPKWHMNKQNIPTMGGFMFIIGIALAVILGGLITGTLSVHALAILGLSAAYGAVGLVDDYAKIKKKENAGLTPRQKLVLQILVAAVFILVLFLESDGLPSLMIPFTGISIDLPWPVYIIFAAFVIVGADNAVNLTDGIDGLAASVTVPVAVFFAAVGARIGNTGVTIFAGALAGGLLGFLIYNFNPAKVFAATLSAVRRRGRMASRAICRSSCCSSVSSTSSRPCRSSCRSLTSRQRTASACSRWRLSIITLKCAAGAKSASCSRLLRSRSCCASRRILSRCRNASPSEVAQ